MTNREELAKAIYLVLLPQVQAPSPEQIEEYLELAASITVRATDALIKELNK